MRWPYLLLALRVMTCCAAAATEDFGIVELVQTLRDEVAALKSENAAQVAALKSEIAAMAHATVGEDRRVGRKAAADPGDDSRRLSNANTATLTYNGESLVLSAPVQIQGSLNVTGSVTQGVTVAAASTSTSTVMFYAQGASFGSPNSGGWQELQMTWTTHQIQNDFGYDGWTDGSSSGRFYAPTDGIYSCSFGMGFMNDDAGNDVTQIDFSYGLAISLGTNPFYGYVNANPGGTSDQSSATLKLIQGEYVSIMVYATSILYKNNYSSIWFSCQLVTAT